MGLASKKFIGASARLCKWVPCPSSVISSEDGNQQYEDLPAVFAGWSQDAKQNFLGAADVRLELESGLIADCTYKRPFKQPDRVTDMQVARFEDFFMFATANSSGSLSMFAMQLPSELPGATTADLKFCQLGESDLDPTGVLVVSKQLHSAPAASVDINTVTQVLLSVAGDGSICLVPGSELTSASAATHTFKQASGWSGYSQGRWVDSHTFATTGLLGGLQLWDERQGPSPVSRSSSSWGHTGCGLLDKQMGPLRQLLCLDVHPSRPTLAATGGSAGTVAIWDLRFQAAPLALTGGRSAYGDVCQCKFDLHSAQSTAAVPPVLYSTLDGALCVAQDAAAAEAAMQGAGGGWGDNSSSSSEGLVSTVLHQEDYAIHSFDVEPTNGRSILAATGDEHILVLQMD